jgi:acetoin utilization protein AcuB
MIRLRDVMKKQVESISPRESAEAAWVRMRARRIRHLVVLDKGQVVGVISDRDLAGPGSFRQVESVGEVMSAPVVSGYPEMTLRQAANQLRGRSIGCLPVMDDERLVGILTTTDLLELIGRGVQHPTAKGKRWILKGRGPRRKPFVPRSAARPL